MDSRIAIITGGSRGLGRSMAEHLARRGVGSVITYQANEDAAATVVAALHEAGARAAALRLDVGDTSSFPGFVGRVRETLGRTWQKERFDFLINNAGAGLYKPHAETTEAELDQLYRVHLKAPYLLTQALLPVINDGGRILNVSTGLARFTLPGYSAYAAMKGGVEVLTRYLATELGARRISVNTVAPGAIATDFNGGWLRKDEKVQRLVASMTALGRVGLPDDVGGAVASLLTDEAGWINGQRIEVSGGQQL